jgi:hypothetical protein
MPASLATSLAFVFAATPTTQVVVESGRGFDWTASGLGAAGGFGLALALVGSIALVRGRPTDARRQRGGRR